MAPFSRTTLLITRLSELVIAITSFALYIVILNKVFERYFTSDKRGLTALPAGALALSILWNSVSTILLIARVKSPRYVYFVGDLVVAAVLVGLGTVGFVHDDQIYFRTGIWTDNSGGDEWWLDMEIAAVCLLYIAALMQLLIAVLAFWRGGNEIRFDRGLRVEELPSYSESTDGKSVAAFEDEKEEKKGKGAESYY